MHNHYAQSLMVGSSEITCSSFLQTSANELHTSVPLPGESLDKICLPTHHMLEIIQKYDCILVWSVDLNVIHTYAHKWKYISTLQ